MKARTVYGYRVRALALSRTFDCEIENWKPFDPLSVSHNITLRSRSTHVNSLNMLHASYGATNRTPRIHFTCMCFTITYETAKHWCHTYGASKRCVSFDQYFSLLRQNTRHTTFGPPALWVPYGTLSCQMSRFQWKSGNTTTCPRVRSGREIAIAKLIKNYNRRPCVASFVPMP